MAQAMHRLAKVRRQRGISLRNVARALKTNVTTVKQQESKTSNLMLSQLLAWQQVLGVPVRDMLVDSNTPLPCPQLDAARIAQLGKTAEAIRRLAFAQRMRRVKRLALTLVDQVAEISSGKRLNNGFRLE